jgi:hypothetical protein
MPAPRRFLALFFVLLAVAAIALLYRARTAAPRTAFVGAAKCASCHAAEYAASKSSQHAVAMQDAKLGAVLGRFDGTKFSDAGLTSTFLRRGDKYVVNTEGPDGAMRDFDVRYTFGVWPLQQYLVELAGGHVQALPHAWDARPAAQGGQRWFSLNPGEHVVAKDEFHWTGRQYNWNYMCADCHSTAVRKGYDARADSFHTMFSEISVSCEACHGPGSTHVNWAGTPSLLRRALWRDDGLPARLTERRGVRWSIDSTTGTASRNVARRSDREIETCAQCHARRAHIADGYAAGAPLMDYYDPLTLVSPLYYPDGQQRDEVYTYASFLQSKMYSAGVTCSDCHNPHTGKLRFAGNQTCAQCHRPAKYDVPSHTLHKGGAGAQCVTCHMPTTTYMQIDARHDHSMRIPRPDLTIRLGVPNSCSRCHDARWAENQVQTWYRHTPAGFQTFVGAFAADDNGSAGAEDLLARVASDPGQPAIVRASALTRLAQHPGPSAMRALQQSVADSNPLVRRAVLSALDGFSPGQRARIAAPLLADDRRAVRIAAAWSLAPVAESLDTAGRAAFDRAAAEFVASQRYNADRSGNRLTLGAFFAARGQFAAAESEFRAAIQLTPQRAQGYINLAAVLQAEGRAADAERIVRDGLATIRDGADELKTLRTMLLPHSR